MTGTAGTTWDAQHSAERAALLTQFGAEVKARTDEGETALAFALAVGDEGVAAVLREHRGVE